MHTLLPCVQETKYLRSVSSQKMALQKNGFPIVFSKSDFGGGGEFFRQFFFSEKPNTPEYAKVLLVMWAKLNSVTALLSPRPNTYAEGDAKIYSSLFCIYNFEINLSKERIDPYTRGSI